MKRERKESRLPFSASTTARLLRASRALQARAFPSHVRSSTRAPSCAPLTYSPVLSRAFSARRSQHTLPCSHVPSLHVAHSTLSRALTCLLGKQPLKHDLSHVRLTLFSSTTHRALSRTTSQHCAPLSSGRVRSVSANRGGGGHAAPPPAFPRFGKGRSGDALLPP